MSYDGNLTPIDYIISNGTTWYIPHSPSAVEAEAARQPNDPELSYIPCPSSYSWKLSDVSAPDAGRTEDALMHKKRVTQKRHLEFEWVNVYRTEASNIINAFDAEYFQVRYWDIKSNAYDERTFYSGDKDSPMYNMAMGIQSSIKFNIIEQ